MMLFGMNNSIPAQDHIVIVSLIAGVVVIVALIIAVLVARLKTKPERD